MKQTIHILFAIIIIAFGGCKKDDVKVQSFNVVSESVDKHATSITITLNYTYPSVIKTVEGYISESANMNNTINTHGYINGKAFIIRFNDLQANTTYYYYYEYSNGIDNKIRSEIKSLTTNEYGLPIITTNDVTNITVTSAVCGGEITDDGEAEIISRGVCYGLNENPTIDENYTIDGVGIGSFTSNLTGLINDTKYYVRAYATNRKGTSYGEQKSFITTDGLPTVTTMDVTNITATTATCGGNVVDDGGFAVTARGVCYSTRPNPTIDNNHTNDGEGIGSFKSHLSDLSSYTTYYVRAYATNNEGTSYGNQQVIKTKYYAPGALSWVFSISSSRKVVFSQGNLQYQASTNTWRFAENQWDYVGSTIVVEDEPGGTISGSSNHLVSPTYEGWIDLFGWGTSNYNHGAVCYQPYSVSNNEADYYAYGSATYNLNAQTGKADWGYNMISNGGNIENSWRTLNNNEWNYVFNERSTLSGIRYAKAKVNDINGVILLPDEWSVDYYNLNNSNSNTADYNSNIISLSIWVYDLEAHGAVFLPASGWRTNTVVGSVNSAGFYMSASYNNINNIFTISFFDNNLNAQQAYARFCCCGVRLVRDVE